MSIVEVPLSGIASNITLMVIVGLTFTLGIGLLSFIFSGSAPTHTQADDGTVQSVKHFFAAKIEEVGILSFMFGAIVKFMMMGLVHEMGHLLMSLALGFDARMGLTSIGLFTYNYTTTPTETILVASGGLLCIPIAYYLMREEDGYDRMEWKISIVLMLLYSIVEVLYFWNLTK